MLLFFVKIPFQIFFHCCQFCSSVYCLILEKEKRKQENFLLKRKPGCLFHIRSPSKTQVWLLFDNLSTILFLWHLLFAF